MALLNGLLYSTPYETIFDVKHSKIYDVQHKNPKERSIFGYKAIKLEESVVYYAGWRPDSMIEQRAEVGEYLVQCMGQPPLVVKTWRELRQKFHVFKNDAK